MKFRIRKPRYLEAHGYPVKIDSIALCSIVTSSMATPFSLFVFRSVYPQAGSFLTCFCESCEPALWGVKMMRSGFGSFRRSHLLQPINIHLATMRVATTGPRRIKPPIRRGYPLLN